MFNQFIKRFSASCAVLAGLFMLPIHAQALNLSIGVGGEVSPGVYGSVNIDNRRHPVLVHRAPLIVHSPGYIVRSYDYYNIGPSFIERRYIYPGVAHVNRGAYGRRDHHYRRDDDRRDYDRRDRGPDRERNQHRREHRHHNDHWR